MQQGEICGFCTNGSGSIEQYIRPAVKRGSNIVSLFNSFCCWKVVTGAASVMAAIEGGVVRECVFSSLIALFLLCLWRWASWHTNHWPQSVFVKSS